MTRINEAVSNNGHTTTTTAQITDVFLSGVDVFLAPIFYDPLFDQLSSAEQSSLANWVSGGGILFAFSENSNFDTRSGPTFSPFGVTTSGINAETATWNTDADPLVAGLTGSTGAVGSGSFTGDVGTVLAQDTSGNVLAFVKDFGQGKVIGFAGVNPWFNVSPAQNETFAARVFALGDAEAPAHIPLPAAGWALLTALGGLVLAGRRKRLASGTIA